MPQGKVASGFEAVASTLDELLAGSEVGAAFAAYVDGELVADIWGGQARPGLLWDEGTLAVMFSCTKGATALCAQILADRGELDVDAPVRRYWPEFRSPKVLVKHCLSHTAGVLIVPGYQDFIKPPYWEGLGDVEEITRRLATSEPLWEPGTKITYHALTYGWLVGEIVRRISGMSLGTFFAREVADVLGLDFFIGTPESEHNRVATLIPAQGGEADSAALEAWRQLLDPSTPLGQANFVSPDRRTPLAELAAIFNRPAVLASEVPAGGGVATARSLARMYAPLAGDGTLDGVTLVSQASIKQFTTEQFAGTGEFEKMPMRYGLGYALVGEPEAAAFGAGPGVFGHSGAGGSLGLADPGRRVAVAFTHNQMHAEPSNGFKLIRSLYGCL